MVETVFLPGLPSSDRKWSVQPIGSAKSHDFINRIAGDGPMYLSIPYVLQHRRWVLVRRACRTESTLDGLMMSHVYKRRTPILKEGSLPRPFLNILADPCPKLETSSHDHCEWGGDERPRITSCRMWFHRESCFDLVRWLLTVSLQK